MGRDPLTGSPLGSAYRRYLSVVERIEQPTAGLAALLRPAGRTGSIAQIEVEENVARMRRAVAGYSFTFSIPKSASVLWAVADVGTQALIADAHHAAVAQIRLLCL